MSKIFHILLFVLLFILSLLSSYAFFASRLVIPQSSVSALTSSTSSSTSSQLSSTLPYSFVDSPSETLKASIIQQSGDVRYISRIATDSATLLTDTLQQGESLVTGVDGRAQLLFPASESATLTIKSQVDIIQSLPRKIVLEHMLGTAKYSNPNIAPLSIRAKRLLLSLSDGEVTLSYDEKKDLMTIKVIKGELTTAYNNASFISQLQTIPAGHSAVFNNAKRKLTVK